MIEDRISLNGNEISVVSGAGWAYHSGKEHSGRVNGFEVSGGKWKLELDKELSDVAYVRLELPDGGTLYYPAKHISGKWIQLDNDPGFNMDKAGKIRFHAFPHSEYDGPLKYTVFSLAK